MRQPDTEPDGERAVGLASTVAGAGGGSAGVARARSRSSNRCASSSAKMRSSICARSIMRPRLNTKARRA